MPEMSILYCSMTRSTGDHILGYLPFSDPSVAFVKLLVRRARRRWSRRKRIFSEKSKDFLEKKTEGKNNPLLGPSSSTLEKMGALAWGKIVHKRQGWRLLTCMWLHAGILHLLANMVCVAFTRVRLEQQFGFVHIGGLVIVGVNLAAVW